MDQIKDLNDLANHMAAYNAQDARSQAKQSHSLEELNIKFTQFIDFMKDQAAETERRRIEAEREAKQASNAPRRPTSSSSGSTTSGLNLPNIPGIKGIVAFTAGLAALGVALAGLRGWEKLAIKNVDKIGKALRSIIPLTFADKLVGKIVPSGYTTFSAWFGDRMAMLRNSALKLFGFDVDMKGGGIPGGNTGPRMPGGNQLKTPLTTQISNRMSSFMSMLKGRYYSMVGLGVDGRPVQARDAAGRFGTFKEASIVHRVAQGIGNMLQPLRAAGSAITEVMSGAFGKMLSSLGSVGSSIKGSAVFTLFKGIFNKVLWPIGVLISAFAGIRKFQEESGKGENWAMSFSEGLTTALSNFVGAPFDLIKNAMLWILRKLLPWGVGEDGKWDDGSMIGKIGIWAEQFSFEKLFKSLLMAPVRTMERVVVFIKDIFSGKSLKEAWSKAYQGSWMEDIVESVGGVLTGIKSLMGFGDKDPMAVRKTGELSMVQKAWSGVTSIFTVALPNKIESIVTNFKEGISLSAGALWDDLKNVFTVAIPAKITAMVTSFTNLFAKTEGAEGDPQPNGSVWTGIKNIFTSFIPNMISDIVTEGKQMMSGIVESVVEKLQGLIDMIFDFIPSAADIKSNVISTIGNMPMGNKILETLNLKAKPVALLDMDAEYQREAFGTLPTVKSFEAEVVQAVAKAVETGIVAAVGSNPEDQTLGGAGVALFNALTGDAVTKKLMPSAQRAADELRDAYFSLEASRSQGQGVLIGNIDNSTTSSTAPVVIPNPAVGSSHARFDPRFEGWGPPNRQHLRVY